MFHLLSGGVKQSPQKNYCCSLYGFLFQKSIRAQEEGGPWMVLSHQEEDALCSSVQGAESRAKLLEQKMHQSCLYFQAFQQPVQNHLSHADWPPLSPGPL